MTVSIGRGLARMGCKRFRALSGPAAPFVLLAVCMLPGAQQQQQDSTEALLEVAARFEAVGRIMDARSRVLAVQELHPAHPSPALAQQRLDSARCPLPLARAHHPPPSEHADGSQCPWRFVVSEAAVEDQKQCFSGDRACAKDTGRAAHAEEGETEWAAGVRASVHVLEVQQGSCRILLEGDRRREEVRDSEGGYAEQSSPVMPGAVYGVAFSHDDPYALRELTDLDDIDVVALEGCEKISRAGAQWHSFKVEVGNMTAPGLLTWVEGTDPYTVARLFAKFEDLDSSVLFPVYSLVVSRNNAVRGRTNNEAAPPWRIPSRLEPEYTMGGAVRVTQHYVDESAAEARDHYSFGFYRATRLEIDNLVKMAKARRSNYYGDTDQFLYQALADGAASGRGWNLKGKDVVIIGSLEPWYEAVCLAEEAASCTTIEYNRLDFEHPRLRTLTVDEYSSMEEKPTFDVALSISSFEHDGLGRYGDPLDANGDLQAMDRMRRVVKPSGFLLLAVPVGGDVIKWNAHRKYGRVRLPVLLNYWSLVAQVGLTQQLLDDPNPDTHIQPVFVLKNDGGKHAGGSWGGGDRTPRSGRQEASALVDSLDWDSMLK